MIFHEIPHAIGDFTLLLKHGVPLKNTVILQIITGLCAFSGTFVGVYLGGAYSSAVLAITCGGIMYLGMTDMMGELAAEKNYGFFTIFKYVIAMCCGLFFMFLLMFMH